MRELTACVNWLRAWIGLRGKRGRGVLTQVKNFHPMGSFGEDVAATYDDAPRGDEDETVMCLERLARGGPALELAIGTGRIGLPLAARRIRVDGIKQSAAMIARHLSSGPHGE